MARKKPSAELVARFDAICPRGAGIERRLVAGFPAACVNGHRFLGLHEEKLVLRLADAARHELLKLPGAKVFEPAPGRPMREYVVVPPLVLEDDAALSRWVERARRYVAALPTKPKKPRAAAPTR